MQAALVNFRSWKRMRSHEVRSYIALPQGMMDSEKETVSWEFGSRKQPDTDEHVSIDRGSTCAAKNMWITYGTVGCRVQPSTASGPWRSSGPHGRRISIFTNESLLIPRPGKRSTWLAALNLAGGLDWANNDHFAKKPHISKNQYVVRE